MIISIKIPRVFKIMRWTTWACYQPYFKTRHIGYLAFAIEILIFRTEHDDYGYFFYPFAIRIDPNAQAVLKTTKVNWHPKEGYTQ